MPPLNPQDFSQTVPLLLQLPPEIGIPLLAKATESGETVQAEALTLLAKGLGVKKFTPRKRGQRGKSKQKTDE